MIICKRIIKLHNDYTMPNLCNVCHNWVKCLLQPVAQSVKWSASKTETETGYQHGFKPCKNYYVNFGVIELWCLYNYVNVLYCYLCTL